MFNSHSKRKADQILVQDYLTKKGKCENVKLVVGDSERKDTFPLLSLPNELILQITKHLTLTELVTFFEIFAFIQKNNQTRLVIELIFWLKILSCNYLFEYHCKVENGRNFLTSEAILNYTIPIWVIFEGFLPPPSPL